MPPSGLAIFLGAGPVTAGTARILASPSHGNLAVALLSRTGSSELASAVAASSGGTARAFATDTSEVQLAKAFDEIQAWSRSLGNLKLRLAVFSIKHSHRGAFLEETAQRYTDSMTTYATGAVVFSQLALKWMLAQDGGDAAAAEGNELQPLRKKGTLVFTGTLGALRTNAGYAAYGGGRAAVRMLAQSLAREYSAQGIHVVHAIANGGITDKVHVFGADGKVEKENAGEDAKAVAAGKKMSAESVGKLYLGLEAQGVDLWCHEVDMRPAAEKF